MIRLSDYPNLKISGDEVLNIRFHKAMNSNIEKFVGTLASWQLEYIEQYDFITQDTAKVHIQDQDLERKLKDLDAESAANKEIFEDKVKEHIDRLPPNTGFFASLFGRERNEAHGDN